MYIYGILFVGFRLGCDMMDTDDITGDILSAIQSIHNTLQVIFELENVYLSSKCNTMDNI